MPKSRNTMQNQAKSCHAKTKQREKKTCKTILQAVHTCTPCSNSIFQRKTVRNKLPGHTCTDPEDARPTKKNWPRKKRMASWARQTEAADGGARARTGADGAVVLNLRRGPGAYALLSRADGQLTRAGQHYYSHLGLRPPSKDFDYNQPLIREGPNDYILLRNGQKKLMRSLQGGEHRLTKLGKGFFRDKYYKYLVHVPVIIRGRRRSGRNAGARYERRDWLPVNELGGATRHPAHLTEEQVVQRVRQQVEASLDPGGPILQLSDETYFLEHEGPEERELPAALRGGRAAERLRGQAALRAPAAGRAAAAERGGGVRRPCCATTGGASASPPRRCESSACGATPPCAC